MTETIAEVAVNGTDDGEDIAVVFHIKLEWDDQVNDVYDAMLEWGTAFKDLWESDMLPLVVNDVQMSSIILKDFQVNPFIKVVLPFLAMGSDPNERIPKGNYLYIAKKSRSSLRSQNGGFFMYPASIASNTSDGKPTIPYVNSVLAFWSIFRDIVVPGVVVIASSLRIHSRTTFTAVQVETFVPKLDLWGWLASRTGRSKRKKPVVPA